MSDTVTRYVVTYINRHGMRTLASPAQGRFTYDTAAEAERYRAVLSDMRKSVVKQVYGAEDPRFEVRPCKCWAGHFDPVGVYFEDSDP